MKVIFVFFVFLCWSLNARTVSVSSTKKFHALIVSAEESYVQGEEKLDFATRDARRVARALETVGQIPKGQVRLLENPKIAELNRVIEKLSRKNLEKFFFYFSGHSDENGLHLKDGSVSRVNFHNMLKKIIAKTKIVILDSCFSGGLKKKGVKKSTPIKLVQYDIDEPTGSVILTSSSDSEFSYESQELKGSIFTYHLVAGLYGQADGNNDGMVTIEELYQYVYLQTKFQSLVSGGAVQHPEFESKLTGRGALVISFPAKINGRIRLARSLDGELTLASTTGLTFFKFYKDKGKERTVSVPEGHYKVTLGRVKKIGFGEIHLKANKEAYLKKSDLVWKKRTKPPVKKKGRPNEFLFGLLMGGHSGFGSTPDTAGVTEIFILTPTTPGLWGRWRVSAHIGGQTEKKVTANGTETQSKFDRLTIGGEGNYPGFSRWNQEWVGAIRVGNLIRQADSGYQQATSLSMLVLGARFYPENLPIKWGVQLSFESSTNASKVKEEATSLQFYIGY